jgi:hypothetical protein
MHQTSRAICLAVLFLPPHPDFPNNYTATDIANSGTIIGQHQISGFPLPVFWVRNAQPTK